MTVTLTRPDVQVTDEKSVADAEQVVREHLRESGLQLKAIINNAGIAGRGVRSLSRLRSLTLWLLMLTSLSHRRRPGGAGASKGCAAHDGSTLDLPDGGGGVPDADSLMCVKVNTIGVLHVCQAFLPHLRMASKGSTIVNISSLLSGSVVLPYRAVCTYPRPARS